MLPGIKLFDLTGRAAIVTGGSKGLGEAMAAGLASAGADILIAGHDGGMAGTAADRIARHYGRKAIGVVADVCDFDSVEAMTSRAVSEFGRIDILVNNAGINIRGPIDQVSEDDFKRVQQTNVEGLWRCCKAVTPHFKQQKSGRIINLASTLGVVGLENRTPYAASKGAVVQMTRCPRAGAGRVEHHRQRDLSRAVSHGNEHPHQG